MRIGWHNALASELEVGDVVWWDRNEEHRGIIATITEQGDGDDRELVLCFGTPEHTDGAGVHPAIIDRTVVVDYARTMRRLEYRGVRAGRKVA